MFGDSFDCYSFGGAWRGVEEGRCCWHLVDRSQGYCSTSLHEQDSPSTKKHQASSVGSAEAEKLKGRVEEGKPAEKSKKNQENVE